MGDRGWLAALAAILLVAGCGDDERARHEVAVPWALGGQWLVADLHTHTRFSDGALTPSQLVEKAVAHGCQALAITDHGDAQVKGASPEYFAEIKQLREKYPRLVLFAGMEWNIPPYGGREHVTVLLDPRLEVQVLPEFRQRYDRREGVTAVDAFKWLQSRIKEPADAVLIYNHPSRQAQSAQEIGADFSRWRAASPQLIGFEGAPGHQRNPAIGAYTRKLRPEHRWDPVAATVGGVWDRLLDAGQNVWGALASSDYHADNYDYPPCGFAQTLVQVPERSPAGVMKALHAGTYWAAHGRFLTHFIFKVSAPGLEIPATPGEVIRYRRGGEVRVGVMLERARETAATPLQAEIIGNCRAGKPEILATLVLDAHESAAETAIAALVPGGDQQSCYVRARVRRSGNDNDDWLAYGNPVRIKLMN